MVVKENGAFERGRRFFSLGTNYTRGFSAVVLVSNMDQNSRVIMMPRRTDTSDDVVAAVRDNRQEDDSWY